MKVIRTVGVEDLICYYFLCKFFLFVVVLHFTRTFARMYQELRKKEEEATEAGMLRTCSDAIMVLVEGCVKP